MCNLWKKKKKLDCKKVNPMFSVTLTTRSDCSQSDQMLSCFENPNQPEGRKNGRFGGHMQNMAIAGRKYVCRYTFSFLCWQSEEYYLQNKQQQQKLSILAISLQQIMQMFLGLPLAHVVANSHLYLSRGKCVSWIFANDILCLAKSVNLCVIQCSLFITFVHFSKVS